LKEYASSVDRSHHTWGLFPGQVNGTIYHKNHWANNGLTIDHQTIGTPPLRGEMFRMEYQTAFDQLEGYSGKLDRYNCKICVMLSVNVTTETFVTSTCKFLSVACLDLLI
jgi:hypothetical protein